MNDKNGKELRCGDIVLISNAYFKNDNGYWFVEQDGHNKAYSSGPDSLTLQKVGKTGKVSTCKGHIAFWPLISFCSDYQKNVAARAWNLEHATIEKVETVPTFGVEEFIRNEIAQHEDAIRNYERFGYGEAWSRPAQNALEYFSAALERITKRT